MSAVAVPDEDLGAALRLVVSEAEVDGVALRELGRWLLGDVDAVIGEQTNDALALGIDLAGDVTARLDRRVDASAVRAELGCSRAEALLVDGVDQALFDVGAHLDRRARAISAAGRRKPGFRWLRRKVAKRNGTLTLALIASISCAQNGGMNSASPGSSSTS